MFMLSTSRIINLFLVITYTIYLSLLPAIPVLAQGASSTEEGVPELSEELVLPILEPEILEFQEQDNLEDPPTPEATAGEEESLPEEEGLILHMPDLELGDASTSTEEVNIEGEEGSEAPVETRFIASPSSTEDGFTSTTPETPVETHGNASPYEAPFVTTTTESTIEIQELPIVQEIIEEQKDIVVLSYTQLMREIEEYHSTPVEKRTPEYKKETGEKIVNFLDKEKHRIKELDVPKKQKKAYLNSLKKQLKSVDESQMSFWDKIKEFFKDLFTFDDPSTDAQGTEEKSNLLDSPYDKHKKASKKQKNQENYLDANRVEKPSQFKFGNDKNLKIQKLENNTISKKEQKKLSAAIKDLFVVEEVIALEDNFLPTIEDLNQEDTEIIFTSELETLAEELEYNPTKILNYLYSNYTYEAYYGSKKGALGCYEQKICNDTDLTSLAITLFRLSDIPARYKSSIAIVQTQQLKELLGVEETKTAYKALKSGNIPTFTIDGDTIGDPLNGQNIDNVDLEQVEHLAIHWTHPEIFISYDERAGNFSQASDIDYTAASTTESLRSIIQESTGNYNKDWYPVEAVIKPYTKQNNEIVHDTANFDTEAFWYGFLNYTGTSTPVQKYTQDLQTQTSKDITSEIYHSTNTITPREHKILPPTTPYAMVAGSDGQTTYSIENFSILPEERKYKVSIRLLDRETNNTLFESTYNASEIDNTPIELHYTGATEADISTIETYGGIHQTPAALVNILPQLQTNNSTQTGTTEVQIGQEMILEFSYSQNNQTIYEDQKFSIAGNNEGIYIISSQIEEHPIYDNPEDENRASKILLEGNAMIAREYLKNLQKTKELLNKTLDHTTNFQIARAVVTQNRILNTIDGTPTTFDFTGLTIDASTYLDDYSNRGNYKTHQKDFRLLWGLEASYQEAKTLTDLTGLEAIATVQGLQYAKQNPEDYTVHTITSENENIIDTLNLSPNTKANMHQDIQSGNTIITPNTHISKNNWNGILYISLDPEWTATYAIGEQVANGGWTITNLFRYVYTNGDGEVHEGYEVNVTNQLSIASTFTYEDRYMGSLKCNIRKSTSNYIYNLSSWDFSYGKPCFYDTITFGVDGQSAAQKEHSYILSTNSYLPSLEGEYSYWITLTDLWEKMNNYIDGVETIDKYHFRFSTVLGTYLRGICTKDGIGKCHRDGIETVYYSPNDNNGSVFRLKGAILDHAGDNNNEIIKILGFPISDEIVTPTSQVPYYVYYPVYQEFFNGRMYYYLRGGNNVFYTFREIANFHDQQGGTSGDMGFPIKDPQKGDGGKIFQSFMDDQEVEWNSDTGVVSSTENIKYRCEVYGNIKDTSKLSLITLQGIWDNIWSTLLDLNNLGSGIIGAIVFHEEIKQDVKDALSELEDLDVDDIINHFSDVGSVAMTTAKQEMDKASCPARKAYLGGHAIGIGLTIGVGGSTKSLTAAKELQAAKWAQYSRWGSKGIGKFKLWMKYRVGIEDFYDILPDAKKNKFYNDGEKHGILHILLGRFNQQKGNFQGDGLHSPHTLREGMKNGDLEVRDSNTKVIYKSFQDIPKEANGVRDVEIKRSSGWSKKSIFPEEWSNEDIIDAIIEASSNPVGVTNQFRKNVTKNGVTVDVVGYFYSNTNLISSGFVYK